jgi:hypothetical protein
MVEHQRHRAGIEAGEHITRARRQRGAAGLERQQGQVDGDPVHEK